jgi:hypothetical protein
VLRPTVCSWNTGHRRNHLPFLRSWNIQEQLHQCPVHTVPGWTQHHTARLNIVGLVHRAHQLPNGLLQPWHRQRTMQHLRCRHLLQRHGGSWPLLCVSYGHLFDCRWRHVHQPVCPRHASTRGRRLVLPVPLQRKSMRSIRCRGLCLQHHNRCMHQAKLHLLHR